MSAELNEWKHKFEVLQAEYNQREKELSSALAQAREVCRHFDWEAFLTSCKRAGELQTRATSAEADVAFWRKSIDSYKQSAEQAREEASTTRSKLSKFSDLVLKHQQEAAELRLQLDHNVGELQRVNTGKLPQCGVVLLSYNCTTEVRGLQQEKELWERAEKRYTEEHGKLRHQLNQQEKLLGSLQNMQFAFEQKDGETKKKLLQEKERLQRLASLGAAIATGNCSLVFVASGWLRRKNVRRSGAQLASKPKC